MRRTERQSGYVEYSTSTAGYADKANEAYTHTDNSENSAGNRARMHYSKIRVRIYDSNILVPLSSTSNKRDENIYISLKLIQRIIKSYGISFFIPLFSF